MVAAQLVGWQVGDDGFANAIVVGLEFLALIHHARARQALRTQHGDGLHVGRLEAGRLARQFAVEGLPEDREHFEQAARSGR